MFSGIGGFELGIQNAINSNKVRETPTRQNHNALGDSTINNSREEGGNSTLVKNIGYSEIDKYAIQIYNNHFKGHKNYGDCTKIDWSTLEAFDLLVGGFPCQAFSIAGKRRGFNDTRGTLFFEIARCLREKQPRLLLLENVKGLLSHDKGRTFYTIISTLDEVGYDVQWQVLNSKNHGVPQNRERVFIIGHLRGQSCRQVFPISSTNETNGQCVDIVAHKDNYRRNRQTFNPEGLTEALDTAQGGGRGHHTIKDMRIRRLTPIECERLQGFPDGWTEKGLTPNSDCVSMSDTRRYCCLGNAVTTNVITAISKVLVSSS